MIYFWLDLYLGDCKDLSVYTSFSDRVQDDDANRKFRGKCKEELMCNSCFQQVKSHSLTLYFIMVSL